MSRVMGLAVFYCAGWLIKFYKFDTKMKQKRPLIILLGLILLSACSRETVILEQFNVCSGVVLDIPVRHSTFPFVTTNLVIMLDAPIRDHNDRDHSDIFTVGAFGADNLLYTVKSIYDINGGGTQIDVVFQEKNPNITRLRIAFKKACSGKVIVTSWQQK